MLIFVYSTLVPIYLIILNRKKWRLRECNTMMNNPGTRINKKSMIKDPDNGRKFELSYAYLSCKSLYGSYSLNSVTYPYILSMSYLSFEFIVPMTLTKMLELAGIGMFIRVKWFRMACVFNIPHKLYREPPNSKFKPRLLPSTPFIYFFDSSTVSLTATITVFKLIGKRLLE